MQTSKGKLTISRTISNVESRNNTMSISIENQDYRLITKIEISPENLMLALTGRALVECEILYRNEGGINGNG